MPFVQREIALNNGPPWGFRLYEDKSRGLVVHKIRPFSPAEDARLREGDVILTIAGQDAGLMNHADAVQFIDMIFNTLLIKVGRYESVTSRTVTFLDQKGSVQDNAVTKVQLSLQREPMTQPASPGLVPLPLSRLMAEHDIPPRPDIAAKKKRFANSEFFDDGDIHYPTVEEKIEMAKQMAESLTAPANRASKGAHIFERQRQRIDKYVKEGPDPEPECDMTNNPDLLPNLLPPPPPCLPPIGFPGDPVIDLHTGRRTLDGSLAPPPPPPPPGAPKTLKEYLEKIKTYPTVKHDAIGPEKCFTIASALHQGNDKGAFIFRRNRQRSVKWEVTSDNVVDSVAVAVSAPLPQKQTSMIKVQSKLSKETVKPVQKQNKQSGKVSIPAASRNVVKEPTQTKTAPVRWRPVKFTVPSRA